jgi:peptidoglycan/xylan/chitin deacetylase (PgdA/CDA1 family)
MTKNTGSLALLLLLPGCGYASGFEEDLVPENISSQQIPPAPEASGLQKAAPGYGDYYAALSYYSDIAYRASPGTDAYLEAYLAGNYLRGKVDALAAGRSAGDNGAGMKTAGTSLPVPSESVLAEVRDVFGFGSGSNENKSWIVSKPVIIKPGFAKIVYVSGGTTPFLVQEDSFLKKGEVILTFDDGPAPGAYSKDVADNLKANSASAVFFVLGQKLKGAGKAVIKDESDKGDFVGVHGYFHATESNQPFTAYSQDEILSQLSGVADTITAATGVEPGFFRPPYGVIDPEPLMAVISGLKLIPLGWTIDTMDWSIKSPDELYAKTTAMIKRRGKGIILMHDIHPQSRELAKRLLVWLKKNNYTVVSPDRLTREFRAP